MRITRLLSLSLAVGLLASCGTERTASSAAPAPSPAEHGRSATSTPARRTPAPQALVTDETQNRLLIVDLPGGRIVRWVPLPPDPEDIAATRSLVIVVSSSAGKLTVLDRHTLRPVKTFGGFDRPHIVAASPDGQYAYVTDDVRGTLTVIRLSDMKVTTRLTVGAGAHHLTFSPDERSIWVALGESANTIAVLRTIVRQRPTPASPIIDAGHPRLIGHFSPGFPAHDLSFSPDGRQIWISSARGPDVTVFDARTRRVLFRVPVGAPPQHLAFRGHFAYVTSGYGSTIEMVNVANGHLVSRAGAPYGSFELSAADGYVATASLLRGTLAIFTPELKLLRVVELAPGMRELVISRP